MEWWEKEGVCLQCAEQGFGQLLLGNFQVLPRFGIKILTHWSGGFTCIQVPVCSVVLTALRGLLGYIVLVRELWCQSRLFAFWGYVQVFHFALDLGVLEKKPANARLNF